MSAKSPEEICRLFQQSIAAGDLNSLLSLYDPEAAFLNQSGDIALMHTDWQVTSPQPMSTYAIEVARRQPDGTWRWLIGDPFTVGRRVAS